MKAHKRKTKADLETMKPLEKKNGVKHGPCQKSVCEKGDTDLEDELRHLMRLRQALNGNVTCGGMEKEIQNKVWEGTGEKLRQGTISMIRGNFRI